jgi:deoxyguanosine kinase
MRKFIAVEGPIGVGKTSLAKRLAASFGSELLLEGPEENPFLERFYKNPRQAALPAQLFFLFQRAHQLQTLRQIDLFEPVRVADFLIDKDRLFAEVTLDHDEYRLYEQVYQHLTLEAPQPDLVIYLQAPVEVLVERIRQRGIAYERNIEPGYLEQIAQAYTRLFHYYDAAPLLIINTATIDLVNNDNDYKALLDQIRNMRGGRQYFNPLPMSL